MCRETLMQKILEAVIDYEDTNDEIVGVELWFDTGIQFEFNGEKWERVDNNGLEGVI